ncbi:MULTISPECIES: CBS domain-containing protein [Pseudofrankia]|uniref:CBS domain-containing protein n=1 Tax=Pseudofrankia TaxID=2994363 RepID=UPI000687E710|nr:MULTISPECIES: CBS domain-containing protein [Pseudofrankia]OHV28449.1 hypothetical protein BCD49_38035 [Pseudofrankia sp. EUN1h]
MDADDIRALRDASLTIGQLLARWGQRVRDDIAVPRISRDLAAAGLTTWPDFARGPLTTVVRVVPLPEPGARAAEEPGSDPADDEPGLDPADDERDAVEAAPAEAPARSTADAGDPSAPGRPAPPERPVPSGQPQPQPQPQQPPQQPPPRPGQPGQPPRPGQLDGTPPDGGRRRARRRRKGVASGQPGADADGAAPWVAMKVGHLPSAKGGVSSVPSGTPLARVTTLMLKRGYSQVLVLDGSSNLRGAVTWRSIATMQGSRRQHTLENATDPDVESVQVTDDLLATLPRITERGFVIVWRDGRVCGIVTTADLATAYDRLAHPYFLIGEIERRLRRCLGPRFGIEDLRAVNPDATSVSNLMFGEYLKLLRTPGQWAKLSWATVDHHQFLHDLDEVRRIRNEIMHFDPRPLTDRQKEHLRQFCGVLKGMDPY